MESHGIYPVDYSKIWKNLHLNLGFPGGSGGKESACNIGDPGSIAGSGRSPGEGNGNPLQYSCLENPMDRGAWLAIVHGVAKSQIRLYNLQSLLCSHFESGNAESPVPYGSSDRVY